jgi:hypothetical protein
MPDKKKKESSLDFIKRMLSPDTVKPPLILNENQRRLMEQLERSNEGEKPKDKKR